MGHRQTLSRCQVDGAPLDSRRGIEREYLKSGHWLSGESHLGGKPRAKRAVVVLYEFPENRVPAKLKHAIVRVAFARTDPGDPDSSSRHKRRRLQYPCRRSIKGVDRRPMPGSERFSRHSVASDAIVAEHEVIPAIPFEVVWAFGCPRQPGDDKRCLILPLLEVAGDQMRKAPAAVADRPILEVRGNQHVEESLVGILEDDRITVVQWVIACRRRRKGIGLGLLEVYPVSTDRKAQMLSVITHAGGVKPVVCAFMKEHRACADRSLAIPGNWDSKRMMLPMHKILGACLSPLMPSEMVARRVVVLVQEIEEPECPIVVERHAVADKVWILRLEILECHDYCPTLHRWKMVSIPSHDIVPFASAKLRLPRRHLTLPVLREWRHAGQRFELIDQSAEAAHS